MYENTVAALHPLTWIHMSMHFTEMTKAPILVVTILVLAHRLAGDTLTHPVLFATTAFVTAQLYRAHGIGMGALVPDKLPEWTFAIGCASMIITDVVWSPIVSPGVLALILRIVDICYVTKGSLAWHKMWCLLPTYILIVSASVGTRRNLTTFHRVCAVISLIDFLVGIALSSLGTVYYKREDWLMPRPHVH